jgi:hypothetical protein
MITLRLVFLVLLSLVTLTAAVAADDLASRLKSARSLRCTFTSEVATWVRSGHRTVEQTKERSIVTYDNIDLAKGTARIIAEGFGGGAGDLTVWWERWGGLWLVERTPSGNIVATTVYPMYGEGTDEFVVLEARHSTTGQIVLGQDSFGTCKILD